MVESKAKWKRLIAFMLAFAMIFSSIAVSSLSSVTVQAASKNVKKVTLKVGSKDVTKKTINVYSGDKTTLKVSVSPKASKKKVTYKSTKTNVATVSKKGVITAKKKGTTKIRVTVTGKDKKKTTTYVKVKVKYVKLTLNKTTASINTGASVTLKATSTPSKTVSWSSSNKAVATVTSKGVVKGVKAGTATITASVGQKKATCKVTVKSASTPTVAVTGVQASIEKSEISVGSGSQIVANVIPANASNKTLTYSSSNESVATVNEAGFVTGISAGTAAITVSSANGKTAVVNVTVTYIGVTGITIEADTFIIGVTGTTNLTAKVVPENASAKLVEWSSSNTDVATIDVNGKVTGVSEGTVTITAKATDNSGISAQCVITVSKSTEDGVSMQLMNPYSYEENGQAIENTVLYGNDMDVLVQVRKGGQPLANANVTLKMAREEIDGLDTEPYRYEIKGDHNVTDASGNVHFIIGLKQEYASTSAIKGNDSGAAEVYTLTASDVSSGVKSEIMVNTAQLSTGRISVSNNNLEPAINWSNGDARVRTRSVDGKVIVNYLASQKVSLAGQDTHSVTFTANPMIWYGKAQKAERADWSITYPENPAAGQGASGIYSVYNNVNNTTTTTQIQDVPDGIKYITLNFKKINLSEYTKVHVDLYYVDENGKFTAIPQPIREITRENNTKDKELSVQVDATQASNASGRRLVISVESKGRVSVSEDGYVLSSLKGTWGTEQRSSIQSHDLPAGTVQWSDVSKEVTYEQKNLKLTNAEAIAMGLPANSTGNVADDYSYQYRVPVFPYTGDAFITVTNKNGSLVGTYAYPASNQQDKITGNYLNSNDLHENSYSPMMVTSDEANNIADAVVTQVGNNAVVNASKTGMTALKATININGLSEDDFNRHNGKELYTSVQWSPVTAPAQETKTNADYYAVEGQTVTIIAQLLDPNNNKAAKAGQPIQFSCDGNTDISLTDPGEAIVSEFVDGEDRKVVLLSDITTTDSNGQIEMLLLGDGLSVIENLKASNPQYKVALSIASNAGNVDISSGANIYWVDLGVSYDESALAGNNIHGEVTDNLIAPTEADTTSELMSDWHIGYLPTARVVAKGGAYSVAIEAVNIPITYSVSSNKIPYLDSNNAIKQFEITAQNAATYLKQSNNVATIHSDRTIDMYLTGKINASAISTSNSVSFKVKGINGEDVEYVNVGKGESQAINNTGLKHTIKWNGTNIQAVPSAAKTNLGLNEEAVIRVQLKDSYGNVYPNVNLACSYVLPNGLSSTGLPSTAATNANGVAEIRIPADYVGSAGTCMVTFTGENGSIRTSQMITYTEPAAGAVNESEIELNAEAVAE